MKRARSVDEYIENSAWRDELTALRGILRKSGLEETVKWGAPVYTLDGANVVGMGGFTSYFGLWFFQGALLRDPRKVLVNAQEGRTRALRQLRFTSADEIDRRLVRAYVEEAAELARRGEEIKPARGRPVRVPPELEAALAARPRARAAFAGLTSGKRREYADYVAQAKRADTKQRRIDKILPMIESGAGLNDRYRSS